MADHQIVNMEFEGGVTVSLTMSAFTDRCERIIRLQGSHGQISGWMEDNRIEVVDFATGQKTVIDLNAPSGGHSGSDAAMMKQFVRMIAQKDKERNLSSAVSAVDSHLLALAAEKSRKNGGAAVILADFRAE